MAIVIQTTKGLQCSSVTWLGNTLSSPFKSIKWLSIFCGLKEARDWGSWGNRQDTGGLSSRLLNKLYTIGGDREAWWGSLHLNWLVPSGKRNLTWGNASNRLTWMEHFLDSWLTWKEEPNIFRAVITLPGPGRDMKGSWKLVSITPLWLLLQFVSCLEFLSYLPFMMDCGL